MLPEGVKTKKCKRKPKVKPQPELPASPNEEISPKTKIPQGSRSELEVGRETPETEVLTVPQPLVSGQESGVSSSMPPPKDRPIRSKLSRRFYEPILLLHLLDSIRGTHIKRHTDSEDPRDSRQERRRDLTDAIAYICAFNTGGKHVTAAALEATPQGITVWLAVNGDIAGEATIVFLRDILTELENIDDQDQASQERTEARVFSKIVGFNKRRVKEYWKRAKNEIDSCLGVIRGSDEFEGRDELIRWLEVELPCFSREEESLVRECYSAARRGGTHQKQFVAIERFMGDGKTKSDSFEILRHHIGKLGKHLAITKRMVKTSIRDRTLFSGFEVKLLDTPKTQVRMLVAKNTTLKAIFGRMFTDSAEKDELLDSLKTIGDALRLDERLKENRIINTWVHAELLLVDHFHTGDLRFVDGDKYVGCSKPACFLCFQYISAHPGGFTLPATHQKLYTGWRHPDIIEDPNGRGDSRSLERLVKCREKITNDMVQKIRTHLIAQIRTGVVQRKSHPDSSTGISTYLASLSLIP